MDKETLIQGLNQDLAHEYQAIIQYVTYAATVSGIHRGELKEFFLAEIQDELRHAQFLADKIAALGGKPTTQPVSTRSTSPGWRRCSRRRRRPSPATWKG